MKSIDEEIQNLLKSKSIKSTSRLLGGMMNTSYVFVLDNKKYVYYVPFSNSNKMVDRTLEYKNIKLISSLDISPENIYFDKSGVKINRFIEGKSLNKTDVFDVKEVAKLLHKLHDAKLSSNVDYEPFKKVQAYLDTAKDLGIKLDKDFYVLYEALIKKKEWLLTFEKTLCHNDFQKSNIIKADDGKYYLIDFEFMMDNDPIYDIACFGNNDVLEGYALLNEYYTTLSRDNIERFFYWRMLISLQWYLVALIKDFNDESSIYNIDFISVASTFLDNARYCKKSLIRFGSVI